MNRDPIKISGVTFALKAPETLYYASALSGVPFIESIAITSEQTFNDVELRVRVLSAAGPVSQDFTHLLASVGPKFIKLENKRLVFDGNAMFQIADPQTGSVVVELRQGEVVLATSSWDLRILPANFWQASVDDYERAIQFVAAFSQPNHPSIRSILDAAVSKMTAAGAAGQLSGYQDSSLVEPMVKAIYEAIQGIGITYSNPPASWSGGGGQKIRTAQEILEEKVGTCLDTTMLMASCLEQAGLAPLVIMIPGHAFVGYWTGEFIDKYEGQIPRTPSVQTIDDLKTHLELENIRFVETTLLASNVAFEKAQTRGRPTLDEEGAFGPARYWSHAIDVVSCRRSDNPINPLPARFVQSNGDVQVVEYTPPVVDLEMLRKKFAERDAVSGSRVSLDVPPKVRTWLDSLLDLSLRNPLINFANKRTAVRLLIPTESLGALEDLLQNEKLFQLAPAPFVQDEEGTRIKIQTDNFRGEVPAKPKLVNFLNEGIVNPQGTIHTDIPDQDRFLERMRKTASEAKSVQQDTGSNGLYLALGSLTWQVKKVEVESPLILIPVTLTSKNRGKAFMLSIEESGVTPNFSLVEKLKIEHKINLPGLAELSTDRFGIDVDGTLNYVRDELTKAGLKDFKVNATATLGFFNFSSYRLWKDLLENWKRFENNPLVKHLIHAPGEAFVDPVNTDSSQDLDVLISMLPISADGSQANAIAKAINGNTFVLQGPPGTGKSQTITNLLARALDEGKRVLFVAEKRDALDVVKERIDAAGLGAFSLDLHDKNSTSKAVKQQLSEVIDIHIEADKIGFNAALQDYQAALSPLQNYRDQLHATGELGESIYSAMDTYLSIDTSHAIEVPGEFVSRADNVSLGKLVDATKSLSELGPTAGNSQTNPWSLANTDQKIDNSDLDSLRKHVNYLNELMREARGHDSVIRFMQNAKELATFRLLSQLQADPVPESAMDYLQTFQGSEQVSRALEDVEAMGPTVQSMNFDLSRLEKVDVDALERQLHEAVASNFLVRGSKIKKVLRLTELQLGIVKVLDKATLSKKLELLGGIKAQGLKLKAELDKVVGISLSDSANLFTADGLAALSARLTQLKGISSLLRTEGVDRDVLGSLVTSLPRFTQENLALLVSELDAVNLIIGADSMSINRWEAGAGFGAKLLATIEEWRRDGDEFGFTQLIRWNDLILQSNSFEEAGLSQCREPLINGYIPFEQATNAFKRGFYKSLFENLLVVKGLKTFDGSVINNYVRKLEGAHEQLRVRLPKILGSTLLDQRGFDGSMKIGAIGDLVLSVKQGRSNIPLRTLLEKHWGVISKMTPCVLASPDSAVRFLSPSFEPFDLVVFDEASQIRVANSIGALGRAKAAIVVGDSQQMPPTSVAVARTGASEEEESEEEESFGEAESILDQCTAARVPEIMLSWHYRSEDESLIAFSNHEYYKGNLSTFPTPSLDQSNRRLSLVNVHGQFIRTAQDYPKEGSSSAKLMRTNPIEAKAIVADIEQRLSDPNRKDESIGVVTLNKQQKDLIEELLSKSSNPDIQAALESGVGGEEILLKPLENVQGSERDVILFSLAFSSRVASPDVLPLQFGPIIYQGGHRRLNVAITRARKEVKVFCSFEAKTLEDRKPTSRGLQDLAKFMRMAGIQDIDSLDSLVIREERLDRHRTQVAAALREAGLEVIEEVGLSDFKVDIAIMDPSQPKRALLGILLDGQRWNRRKTVSDRDSLPISMLTKRMGWAKVERIWLPTWLRNQASEIERIKLALEDAKKVPVAEVRKSLDAAPTEPIYVQKADMTGTGAKPVNPVDSLLAVIPTWRELQPAIIAGQEYLDYLQNPKIRDAVADLVQQLTETEGPVSKQRLAKFVASCFGYSRVVTSRVEAINGMRLDGHSRDQEGFLYPHKTDPRQYNDWQKSEPGFGRNASEISLREIGNAMVAIATAAQGVSLDQLVKETTRVFGIQKVSKDTAARFEQAVKLAFMQERLKVNGDYIEGIA